MEWSWDQGGLGAFTLCVWVCRQEELLEPTAQTLLPAVPGDKGLGRFSYLAGTAAEEPLPAAQ